MLRPALVEAAAARARANSSARARAGAPGLVVTLPWRGGRPLHNAVALVADGRTELRFKHELPNYGVFDEKRVFAPGPLPEPVMFRGVRLGLPICEDIWFPTCAPHLGAARRRAAARAQRLAVRGREVRSSASSSRATRVARDRACRSSTSTRSAARTSSSSTAARSSSTPTARSRALLPFWRESLDADALGRATAAASLRGRRRVDRASRGSTRSTTRWCSGCATTSRKNRFPGVVLGLSGGIDSALTAAVAVDALGADARARRAPAVAVHERREPGRCRGIGDGCSACGSTRCRSRTAVAAAEAALAPLFAGRPRDVTEENLQARVRGLLLMALSNKFGELLVTTGNKSEMSVGYATLYGDMCGGYSVLKDIYKTEVYALSRWRNEHVPGRRAGPAGRVIPESSITKAPTAELRPEPDRSGLAAAVRRARRDPARAGRGGAERGRDRRRAGSRARRSRACSDCSTPAEYKRRQAPPGVKITRKSFGRDRRYPITNAFREPDVHRGLTFVVQVVRMNSVATPFPTEILSARSSGR